jgi:hypothetical protein
LTDDAKRLEFGDCVEQRDMSPVVNIENKEGAE